MKLLYLVIMFWMFLFLQKNGSGQTNIADSLKKVYQNAKSDTAKLEALVTLQELLTIQDEQIINLNQELILAGKLQKLEIVAEVLGKLGWFKYQNQEFMSADSFYRKSLEICKKYNYSHIEGSDYIGLMMLHWWQGETKEGVAYFEKAEGVLQKADDSKELSRLYLNASELYKNLNFLDQSLAYAKKSLDYANKSLDSGSIIQSAIFLGSAYDREGEPGEALNILKKALLMAQKRNDEFNEGEASYFLGDFFLNRADYSNAGVYLNNALRLYSKLKAHDRVSSVLSALGDMYFFNKDFIGAKKNLLQTKKYLQPGDIMGQRYVYKGLANIDLVNKDIDSWKKNTAIADSLENLFTSSEVKKAVMEINTKYQTSLKEKQIQLLQQQKNIQRFSIGGLLFALIAITVISFFIYRYLHQKRLNTEKENIQLKQERQLIAVNSLLHGQEAERSRMAKDLHDGLGGMLSGIKLNLSSISENINAPEKETLLYFKSIGQLDNAIAEMRRVAHNMMPEALLKFGLTEAIKDFSETMGESKVHKIKFTSIGNLQNLEQTIAIIIYRMVQELVNNVIKHAKAKNIFIQLTRHERGITLTVEDDGVGFDHSQLHKLRGTGLQNVQSRIDYLKGNLSVESTRGKGTSMVAEIPVRD